MGKPEISVEKLYRAHGQAIYNYLLHMLDLHAAEDLLQQTFTVAIESPGNLKRVQLPRAWLFGIARHLAMNHLRRCRKIVMLPENCTARSEKDDSEVIEMRQAISKLPATLRETLRLRLHDELSYQEIAEVLEIPIGTVRSRLHNAVGELRRIINDDHSIVTRNTANEHS